MSVLTEGHVFVNVWAFLALKDIAVQTFPVIRFCPPFFPDPSGKVAPGQSDGTVQC